MKQMEAGRKGGNPNTVYITYNGKTLCMGDWDVELELTRGTVGVRKRAGWTDAQALGFEPPPRTMEESAAKARAEQTRKLREKKARERRSAMSLFLYGGKA